MKVPKISAIFFIALAIHQIAALPHGDIQLKSSCTDTHISYEIPIPREQSNVLRLRAGTCTESNSEVYNYDNDRQILHLNLPFEDCGLKEYSDDPVYRSSTYYSSTIEIEYGIVDDGFLEVIFHTAALAVQCEVERDYIVEFSYDIEDRPCEPPEKLINGVCVWFGATESQFEILEYTDATYSERATAENRQKISGEMIYLGIVSNNIPTDFTWGVETCWIVETELTGNEQAHMLFDPAGTSGELVDNTRPSCTRNSLQLEGHYHSINPGFRLQHLLFMLNHRADESRFKMRCHIKLCCIGEHDDAGTCENTDSNEICGTSRNTCGGSECDPINYFSDVSDECNLPEGLDTSGFVDFADSPIVSEFTKAWFGVSSNKMTWHQGKAFCEGKGLEMARVYNAEENLFIYNMPREPRLAGDGKEVWIGGSVPGISVSDKPDKGAWFWTNNKQICYDGYSTAEPFDPWGVDEPNNGGNGEGCLEIGWHGDTNGWNDWPCNMHAYVACEFRCLV